MFVVDRRRIRQVALLLGIALPCASHADAGDPPSFKLTAGDYRYGHGQDGQDLNVRWQHEGTDVWIGGYHDPVFGTQTRTGFDTSLALGGSATVQPSLQAASGGFLGGSVNVQIGDPWFVLLGWGRTNLKPYFNLNFDPNDAVTAGVGWHGSQDRTVSVMVVSDDRLHTGQTDWHLYGRMPLSAETRLTLDVLHKSGQGDGGYVRAWGASASLDFPAWFLRLAYDPQQNFSVQDATRFVVGARF